MKFCANCIMPNTRPEQVFENGICDACVSARLKTQGIDWNKRAVEFENILRKYRGDGSKYDCIIPVSGEKIAVIKP